MRCDKGHTMCDLCGRHQKPLVEAFREFGNLKACDSCVRAAIETVYTFACRWAVEINQECKQ